MRDAGSGAPIEGALVTAHGYAAVTTATGSYTIANLRAGTYSATASKRGYAPDTATGVTIVAGSPITVDFDLVGVPLLEIQSVFVDDATGNANGLISPDECVELEITVINTSGGDATGVVGTLSTTTPEATITVNSSSYPAIGAGGGTGTNTVRFELSTSASFVGGTPIELTLDLASAQGPFQDPVALGTSIGTPGTPAHFENNTAFTIVDIFGVLTDSPIAVSGVTGSVFDVRVDLHITHIWDSDVIIDLVAPDGTTTTTLAAQVGGGGDNFGTDCPAGGNDTRFSDSASTSILDGTAPFVGSFAPQEPLSVFAGLSGADLNGTWILRLQDPFAGFEGTLHCWALTVTPVTPDPGPGSCSVPTDVIFADGFESGDDSAWSSEVP